MNRPASRTDIELFTASLAEKRRRLAKIEHQTRGYRDEDGVWHGGLLSFVKYFWHVLEPGTPFVSGWVLEAICEHLEAVSFGEVTNLLVNTVPGSMKSMLTNVFFPAFEWGPLKMPHIRYVTFSYSSSLTERDNGKFKDLVCSEEYQLMYGDQVQPRQIGYTKVSNYKHGWKLASSVGGVGTGQRGDRIIGDDLNNVKESESQAVLEETNRWFRESMSSRLNNMETGAKIIISQRVSEGDVSGTILDLGLDYCHLLIPMEFVWQADENGQPYTTQIGWVDPRWRPTQEECDGELAWPDRFPEEVVARIKKELGPYAYCTPAESPVLMADLSLKPISEVVVGDMVLGFCIGNDDARARHLPARVLSIGKFDRPVVKLTLDSGLTARCTRDHKWFTGRNDASHQPYKAVKVGSQVKRVCPAVLPKLETEDELRSAGWVAGFFDGEGTVSLMHRRNDSFACGAIAFYQTAGKNLPLCEKLERSLDLLGFNYSCDEKQPSTLSAKGIPWSARRAYVLKSDAGVGRNKNGPAKRMSRLTLNQRFLSLIQPVKWKERLIDISANGRMYTGTEKVISIEPDGIETVYGLETTTGNYVVWGLASSNSAQYQQTPEARGGGILKREWWQPAEEVMSADGQKYPPFSYIVASLDGAFTEKEENDPSALTVWGVFQNELGYNRAMLIHAWSKKLPFSGPRVEVLPGEHESVWRRRAMPHWGLIEWTADTCKRFKADKLLIENKASGISTAQSLRNSHGREGWAIELVEPKGDKVARALAIQPTFSQGMIYAPDRVWATDTVDECAVFPKGRHDDRVDSTTQAIKHLRDNGLIRSDEERRAEELDAVRHKGAPKPPRYPGFRAQRM